MSAFVAASLTKSLTDDPKLSAGGAKCLAERQRVEPSAAPSEIQSVQGLPTNRPTVFASSLSPSIHWSFPHLPNYWYNILSQPLVNLIFKWNPPNNNNNNNITTTITTTTTTTTIIIITITITIIIIIIMTQQPFAITSAIQLALNAGRLSTAAGCSAVTFGSFGTAVDDAPWRCGMCLVSGAQVLESSWGGPTQNPSKSGRFWDFHEEFRPTAHTITYKNALFCWPLSFCWVNPDRQNCDGLGFGNPPEKLIYQ